MAGTTVDPLATMRGAAGSEVEGSSNSSFTNGIATSTLMKGLLGVDDTSFEAEDRPRSRRSPSPGAGGRGVRHKTSRDRLASAVVDGGLPHPQHPNRSPTRGTIGFDPVDAPPLPVPSSPQMPTQMQLAEGQQQQQLASPAAVYAPVTRPLTINTSKTVPHEKANGEPDTSVESTKEAQRPDHNRNRSSSRFSLMGRKRSSSGTNDLSLTKSRESNKSERSLSPTSPKADLAALSKPKSKFKSGAKWDSVDVTGANLEQEPYLDTQDSPTQEKKQLSLSSDAPSSPLSTKSPEELRAMATSGSTAALRALASSGQNIGAPIFAAQERAAQEAAAKKVAAEKEANEKAFAAMGFQPVRTPSMPAAAPHSRQSSNNSIQGRPTMQAAPSMSSRSVNEAAQRVLQEARNAARGASNGLPPAAAAIPPPAPVTANGARISPPLALPGSSLKQSTTAEDDGGSDISRSRTMMSDAETTTDSVKNSRRRSLLSMPSFSRENKSSTKLEKRKTKSRGPSRANTPPPEEETRPSLGHTKSSTDDGTPRRRRFADTRELDLLATELAAQSLADHHLSMGVSHMPVSSQFMTAPVAGFISRRGSEAGPGGSTSPLSNTSQVSLGNGGGSGASSSNGHGLGGGLGPLSQIKPAEQVRGSPTFTPAFDARSLPGSATAPNDTRSLDSISMRSGNSFPRSTRSMPGSPYTGSRSQLSSLPTDMLTGLGDGPYPSLGRRLPLDPMDALGLDQFGVPILDASAAAAADVNSSRSKSRQSSITSHESRQLKKSVMSISMNDNSDQGLVRKKTGWSSPFGSRSPSRANSRAGSPSLTPSHSNSNLREKAKSQAAASAAASPATVTAPSLPSAKNNEKAQSTTDLRRDSSSARTNASVNTEGAKMNRKSFFGTLRRKSQMDMETSKTLSDSAKDAPPVPTLPANVNTQANAVRTREAVGVTRRRSKSESAPSRSRFARILNRITQGSTSSQSGASTPSTVASPKMQPMSNLLSGNGGPGADAANRSGMTSPTSFVTAGSPESSARQSPTLQINGIPNVAQAKHFDASAMTLGALGTELSPVPEGGATPTTAAAAKMSPQPQPAAATREKLDRLHAKLANGTANEGWRANSSSSGSAGSQAGDDFSPPTSESQDGNSVGTPSTDLSASNGTAYLNEFRDTLALGGQADGTGGMPQSKISTVSLASPDGSVTPVGKQGEKLLHSPASTLIPSSNMI